MFRSHRRAVVYSQYEHARLAGALAERWGNARFPRPALPFDAFVAGVALHDFGYGVLDEHPIGEMDRTERLATLAALVEARLADPVAEALALHHARRLIADNDAALTERCEARIVDLLARTGIDRAAYEAADRITDLCDSIAFHFCFEHEHAGRVRVPASAGAADRSRRRDGDEPSVEASGADGTRAIDWTVDAEGRVTLSPWPLAVPSLDVLVVAFEARGYPETLVPRAVPCEVRPG